MHILTALSIFLLVYCLTVIVEADFQRTYKFGNYVAEEKASGKSVRKKRADLIGNDTVIEIQDMDGNTAINAHVCVRPDENEQNVSLIIGDVVFLGLASDYLVFFLNGSEIGNLTVADVVKNETVTNDTIILGETGPIGNPVTLPEGDYLLQIFVTTDMYGIELYSIMMNATRQDPTEDIFCGGGFNISVSGQ
jgi:hypothetical protein